MFKNIASNIEDSFSGHRFDLKQVNAIELKNYLISNYQEAISIYGGGKDDTNISNLREIYLYQNFFLLEKNNKYYLLDGFRRLLIFNPPDEDILVRVYRDIDDKSLLKMLVALNHQKLINGDSSSFQQRGFSLAINTIYGIDISNFRDTFAGYLGQKDEEFTSQYYDGSSVSYSLLKERIITDKFIDDMKILSILNKNNIITFNKFGVYLAKNDLLNLSNVYDFVDFLNKSPLYDKLKNNLYKSYDSRKIKILGEILEFYKKTIEQISKGTVGEKTFSEIELEISEKASLLRKELKKKKYTKISNRLGIDHNNINIICDKILSGDKIEAVAIVIPTNPAFQHIKTFEYGIFENEQIVFTINPEYKPLKAFQKQYNLKINIFISELNRFIVGKYYNNYNSEFTLNQLSNSNSKVELYVKL